MVALAYHGHSRICIGCQSSGDSTSKLPVQRTRFFNQVNCRICSRQSPFLVAQSDRHVTNDSWQFFPQELRSMAEASATLHHRYRTISHLRYGQLHLRGHLKAYYKLSIFTKLWTNYSLTCIIHVPQIRPRSISHILLHSTKCVCNNNNGH